VRYGTSVPKASRVGLVTKVTPKHTHSRPRHGGTAPYASTVVYLKAPTNRATRPCHGSDTPAPPSPRCSVNKQINLLCRGLADWASSKTHTLNQRVTFSLKLTTTNLTGAFSKPPVMAMNAKDIQKTFIWNVLQSYKFEDILVSLSGQYFQSRQLLS
jgi:hypothetical protein